MAATIADIPKTIVTERGQHALVTKLVTHFANSEVANIDIDTADLGAAAVAFFIDNVGATIALTGKLMASMDGSNWINVKYKDQSGTETAAGTTVAVAATSGLVYLIVHNSSYPETLSMRYIRLVLTSNGPPAAVGSPSKVYVVAK